MSCKEHVKREEILKNGSAVICGQCDAPLTADSGALAFGNDMLTTFICKNCGTEEMLIIRESGEVMKLVTPDFS